MGWVTAALLATVCTLSGIPTVWAQSPPEPTKPSPVNKQSTVNPYPKDKGNNQNRGRGGADVYWGVTDANRSYRRPAYSRVPDVATSLTNPGMLELDGWGFPRGAYQGGVYRLSPSVDVPPAGSGVPSSGNFVLVTGPSTDFSLVTGYFRAPAIPRPNISPFLYSANPNTNRYVWNMNVLNVAGTATGQQVRFQVQVLIPTPPEVQAAIPENRISDARYVVYYYLRTANGIFPKRKAFTLSQLSGGELSLLNADGQPAFFPFFTSATDINSLPPHPELGVPFQGVTLDDTTGDDGANLFVLADGLRLIRSVDFIAATPTVTAPHGGRRAADADPTTPGIQNWPDGTQPNQPVSGAFKQDPTIAAPDTNIVNPVAISALDFVNLPGDPRYDPAAPEYDPTQPYQSWNVSTLFRGPESLIEPRRYAPDVLALPPGSRTIDPAITPSLPAYPFDRGPDMIFGTADDPDMSEFGWLRVGPGTPNRPQIRSVDLATGLPIQDPNAPAGTSFAQRVSTAVDANNHDIYRRDLRDTYDRTNNPAVPYFSHMQVIFPKVEYVLDPENGVPDAEKDGTLARAVGSVWCLDWLTGAPIWRFPDRTYAPGNARNPYLTTSGGTTFDPNDPAIQRDPATNARVTLIPGIEVVDKNLDNVITDDEVFIVGQGLNPNGGVFASVTYSPRVRVRGNVQIPTYTVNTNDRTVINTAPGSTVPAPAGRYYTAPNPANPNIGYRPVDVGMVFIAGANGVLYAVDAYGNNDNDYFPNQDYRVFGEYRPGTTNVLWSFSRPAIVRGRADWVQTDGNIPSNETLGNYYERAKAKIPPTGSFDGSAPVLEYRRDDRDFETTPFDPAQDELRLFVGNANGVLYAMDAEADAGVAGTFAGFTGVQDLPFRKELYQPVTGFLPSGGATRGPVGLRWWFQSRGSIVSTPAVSLMRQNAGGDSGNNDPIRKGVYFTSTEGRVYCIDWEGPVSKANHQQAQNYDLGFDSNKSGPNVVPTAVEDLNDNYLFHNIFPANSTATADLLEGTVRPRWTFPNLYRDIDNTDNRLDQPADDAQNNPDVGVTGVAGTPLAEPETTLGPITTSPVLVDFPWKDPLIATSEPQHISYVVVQADDATTNGIPASQSRVYLLDQTGDRVNFLSNTTQRGPTGNERVISHPKDRFSPKQLLGSAAPAWTFRMVYDWYSASATATTATRDMPRRNSPIGLFGNVEPPLTAADFNANPNRGLPGRRIVPTLFVGGVGRMFALDFDPETALFARWRPTLAATRQVQALPDWEPLNDGTLFPGPEAERDRLFPIDPILDPATPNNPAQRANLRDRRLLVRTLPLAAAPSAITNIAISGGVLQNRSTLVEYLPPTGSGNGIPPAPTVPPLPTNDAPNLRPGTYLYDPPINTSPPYPRQLDATGYSTRFDESGMRVNQDINDPISTTEGQRGSNPNNLATDPGIRVPNTAYQYPMLFVTDENGYLHGVSTNIEGEDYDTSFSAINESSTVGWGVWEISRDRFSPDHSLHFIVSEAGGTSGVAVVTNAYFPSLNPEYLNADRAASNPFDPFRFYQNGEPNTTSPTPYRNATSTADPPVVPVQNSDDPRPDFRPRSFSTGTPADPGPDGITGTADDILATPSDRHTGESGFPLDLNGLFFDKRFAGRADSTGGVLPPTSVNNGLFDPSDPANPQPNALELREIPGQHPNGNFAVKLRLPGYSYIGGNIDEADTNNQVPDGARTNRTLGNTEADDINPSAQNVTWLFAGGYDGVLKAYTPAAAGQTSGFAAGIQTGRFPRNGRAGYAQVAIVDEATYNQVLQDAQSDGRLADNTPQILVNNSIARQGGRNFYEYGESVYIIVFDLLAQTNLPGEPIFDINEDFYILPGDPIQLQITGNDAPVETVQQRLELGPNGKPAYYFQVGGNPLFDANPGETHFSGPNATPFGIVAYRLQINNPNSRRPLVPGDQITIAVQQQNVRPPANGQQIQLVANPSGAGANSVEQALLGNADTFFAIANPLALQGFLQQTQPSVPGGILQPVGAVKTNIGDTQNGIGPFEAQAQQNGGTKTQVADTLGSLTPGTTDPDKAAFDYSQALVNGNLLQRRDLRRFINNGGNVVVNPRYGYILQEGTGAGRTDEPAYYFPVIASAGYINHGETGSTDTGTNRDNLRVLNRSLLPSLPDIRVVPAAESMLWRSWPGRVPNAEANLYDQNGSVIQDNSNPRLTPVGMDPNGRVNRLPWEIGINENRPWNPTALINSSPDYPNISARAERAIRVSGGSGNYTESTGALPAIVNGAGAGAQNASVVGAQTPSTPVNRRYSVAAQITVPKHQPANIVALHNLTSSYQPPSSDDAPNILTGTNPGPVQVPRGLANRDLVVLNPNGTSSGQRAITPFGYTVRMTTFLDYDKTGRLSPPTTVNRNTGRDPNNRTAFQTGNVLKAYREFELSFGIPIDMNMKVVETEIDLGKLNHSFGVQNGLLGYNGAAPTTFAPGFLPPPLVNTSVFGTQASPYNQFFKKFTIQNLGNVNLWNLRASQRREVPGVAGFAPGSGNTFAYFGLRSNTVDNRFGILAVGADPAVSLLGQPNLTPLVATSLDRQYDAAWDVLIQTRPEFVAPLPSGSSPYQLYYQQLAGRHTLHKPRVGVNASATLGVPDIPGNQFLRPVGDPQPTGSDVVVGVAVPIGTPIGEYTSKIANNPLVVFEDHDTNQAYNPTPGVAANGAVTQAGPFYAGSQVRHPGVNPILSAGAGNGEGIWRIRRALPIGVGGASFEYQPATLPGISLKLNVTESSLTGDVADRALESGGLAASIASGRLPGIDFFPLIDNASGQPRAAAALSPAAYRGADGSLHVYFSRNSGTVAAGNLTQPGQPYQLFHSHLLWNPVLGTFVADSTGVPLVNNATAPASAITNTGKWFTTPVPIFPGDPAVESNVSPYVLQTAAGATLFWMNSRPTPGGQALNQVYFTSLNANGTPVSGGQPLIEKPDASVQRYSPRALYDDLAQRTMVFYHGGSSGRWGLFYVARPAAPNGAPTGTVDATTTSGVRLETPLALPEAIASASDPTPVLRTIRNLEDTGNVVDRRVVDVYYTGISRATQTPDVYMNRYEVGARRGNLNLSPIRLPRVFRERLTKPGRDPIYQSRHIGWEGRTQQATLDNLPTIYVGPDPNTAVAVAAPVDNMGNPRWQRDNATGVLYQSYGAGVNETIVYVDTAAGTVRFRGRGAPTGTQYVFADYQPTTYRITVGGVSNVAPMGFVDNTLLPATVDRQNRDVVIRRQNPMVAGRHWLFWQRGAEGNRASTLFYTARRVGIDLKAPSTLGARLANNDSIQLFPRNGAGNQVPYVNQVQVLTSGGGFANVPYEVDYVTGRIYVEPQHEGLPVRVFYVPTSAGLAGGVVQANGFLTYLDELSPASQGTSGIQVPLNRAVNEGQVYAFLDTFAVVPGRTNPAPAFDPTLTPGRVWMFWTSPRGRTGSQLIGGLAAPLDPFPGGFDLYWQTIAPVLDPLTSTNPQ
jgi:hypothetical protein